MSNPTMKEVFEESMDVMKDSISAMLLKEAGRKLLDMLRNDQNLSSDLMTTGAMMTAAAATDKNSAHGKLARDLALGMGLSTFDRVFVAGRDALSFIVDPTQSDVDRAKEEAELNALMGEGRESLEQAMSGQRRFSKEKESAQRETVALTEPTITPRNAVVISKPEGPVPEKGSIESKPSRPACPMCGKIMKASKINKLVKLDDDAPEKAKKFNGKKVCQSCFSEIGGLVRASKAEAAEKAKHEKEILDARDNLVKTNESLKAEDEKLKSLAKAHEAVKSISPEVAADTANKMEECRKSVEALTAQKERLEKLLSA